MRNIMLISGCCVI